MMYPSLLDLHKYSMSFVWNTCDILNYFHKGRIFNGTVSAPSKHAAISLPFAPTVSMTFSGCMNYCKNWYPDSQHKKAHQGQESKHLKKEKVVPHFQDSLRFRSRKSMLRGLSLEVTKVSNRSINTSDISVSNSRENTLIEIFFHFQKNIDFFNNKNSEKILFLLKQFRIFLEPQ